MWRFIESLSIVQQIVAAVAQAGALGMTVRNFYDIWREERTGVWRWVVPPALIVGTGVGLAVFHSRSVVSSAVRTDLSYRVGVIADGLVGIGWLAVAGSLAAAVLAALGLAFGMDAGADEPENGSRLELCGAVGLVAVAASGWVFVGLPLVVGAPPEGSSPVGFGVAALLVGGWIGLMGIGYARSLGESVDDAMATTTLLGALGVVLGTIGVHGLGFVMTAKLFDGSPVARGESPMSLAEVAAFKEMAWPLAVTLAGGVVIAALVTVWRADRRLTPRTHWLVGSGLVALAIAAGLGWWLDSHLRGHLLVVQQSSAGAPQVDTVDYTLPTSSSTEPYESGTTVEITSTGVVAVRRVHRWRRPVSESSLARVGPRFDYDEGYRDGLQTSMMSGLLDEIRPVDDPPEFQSRLNWVVDHATPASKFRRALALTSGAGFGPHHLAIARREVGEPFDPDITSRKTEIGWIGPESHDIGVLDFRARKTTGKLLAGEAKTPAPVDVAVHVSRRGFDVQVNSSRVLHREGCSPDGPPICLDGDRQVVRSAFEAGPGYQLDDQKIRQMVAQYDFTGLYEVVAPIKRDHPELERYFLTYEDDVPVILMVCVMDALRYRRKLAGGTSGRQFWKAAGPAGNADAAEPELLFPTPVVLY